MREVLFRGKRHGKGEWVYGLPFYSYTVDGVAIKGIEEFGGSKGLSAVHPESIGQYTGLLDKNGRKIFEGDILSLRTGRAREVKYADGSFFMEGTAIPFRYADRFEIIGNIHDNPELIGGEKE